MPLDAGIYNAFATRPKSIEDYDQEALASQNAKIAQQGNLLGLTLQKQKADEYTRGLGEQSTIRNALTSLGPNATDDQRIAALKATGLQGGFTAADALDKSRVERLKGTAAAAKDTTDSDSKRLDMSIKAHDFHVQQLTTVNNPQDAAAWIQRGAQSGVFTPQQVAQATAKLQEAAQSPQAFAQWKQGNMQGGQAITQTLVQQQAALKQAEDARHNGATEQNAAGQLKVSQGQLGVAQGNLTTRREELQYNRDQPKGVIVQTEAGPVLADPRSGDALPVTMGGKPLAAPGPKLKDIPVSVNSAILKNQQSLAQIDSAIAAIQKRPGSLGPINRVPGAELLRQYTDEGGVNTRAITSDIGSLKLHDRSGANVTVSETPRLAPFVPSTGDKPEAAVIKLQNLRNSLQMEAELLAQQYTEDQGYRVGKVAPKTGGATGSFAPKPASGDIHSQADAILRGGK